MTPASRIRLAACAVLAVATSAYAQQRPLTIDAIYSSSPRADMGVAPAPEYTWIDDEHYLVKTRSGSEREWARVHAASGATTAVFTPGAGEEALALNPAATAILLTIDGDLHVRELASGRTTRLTTTAGTEEEATFSPDGRLVAFVRNSNLHVVDVASQRERALTTDGSSDLLNGKLDWVYQGSMGEGGSAPTGGVLTPAAWPFFRSTIGRCPTTRSSITFPIARTWR